MVGLGMARRKAEAVRSKFVWLVAVASLVVPLFAAARSEAATDPTLILPISGGAIAVDDASGHVFVTRRDNVSIYDLAGTKVGQILDQWGVTDLLLQGSRLYVLASGDPKLHAFDTTTLSPMGTWDIGGMSDIRSMAATTNAMWLTYYKDGTHDGLSKVNLASGAVTIGVLTIPRAADLVGDATTDHLYTVDETSGHSSIRQFDVSSGTAVQVASSPAGVSCTDGAQLALSADGSKLWSACEAPNSFNEWNTADLGGTARTYPAATAPNAIALSGNGQVLVGGTRSPNGTDVWIYDTGVPGVVAKRSVDPGNVYDGMVAVNETGDRVYALTDQGLLRSFDLRPTVSVPPPTIHRYSSAPLAVQGSNFTTVSSVKVGTTSVGFTIVNDHALTFVPPSLAIGDYPITLANHWVQAPASPSTYLHVIADVPANPGTPEITGTDPFTVSLQWAPASNDGGASITGYRVHLYQNGTGHFVGEYDAGPSATSLTMSTLPAEYTYGFKVAAVNSSGTGMWSGLSDLVTVPTPDLGPFATVTGFIDRQFRDVVGRAPSEHERNDWLSKLRRNHSRPIDLVRSLRASDDNTSNVDPVERLYLAYFGRPADGSGLRYWASRSRRGTTLSSISSTFAASSEFKHTYGSLDAHDFVELAYQNVLGRPGDSGGVAYWTSQLESHKRTRGQVMVGFSESAEFVRSQFAEVEAAAIPTLLLGRGPTADELDTWVSAIDESATNEDLVASILASPEYAERIAALS
jgi:hypothetical protein